MKPTSSFGPGGITYTAPSTSRARRSTLTTRPRDRRGAGVLQEGTRFASARSAQSYPRRSRAESARAVATARRASALPQSGSSNLQVPQQHRRAGPPGDQATLCIHDGIQIVPQRVDRACGSRVGSSDSQAPVLVRSRTASSSVNESDVDDGDGVKRRPRKTAVSSRFLARPRMHRNRTRSGRPRRMPRVAWLGDTPPQP